MASIMIKRYGIGLCLNIALIVIACILCAVIVNIIPISFENGVAACYILGTIIGIAGVILFVLFIDAKKNIMNEGDKDDFWVACISDSKPVKFHAVFLRILPMFAIFIMLIVCMIIVYKPLIEFMQNTINQIEEAKRQYNSNMSRFLGVAVISMILPVSAVNWLFYFFYNFVHYRSVTCKACGCVLYFISKYVPGSLRSYERTEYKNKDKYGKVGELHVNGSKAGDIRGKIGVDTYERKISGYTEKYTDKCLNCGAIKERYEGSCNISDWS